MNFLKKNYKYLFSSALFVVATLVWYAVFSESRNGLEVDFLDVGQGDAIFIQAENGNQVLIDGGPNKSVLRQLSRIMPFYDRSIDILILTHSHTDHLSGLIDVIKRYKINAIIESGTKENTPEYEEWERVIKEKNINRFYGKRGTRLDLGGGLNLDFLLPIVNSANIEPHDGMIVAEIAYGKNSFLLMGDAEKVLENYLVSLDNSVLKSDILKIGHHGSNNSTSESLIGYVDPKYVVISVGKDNKYGHPHKETVDVLNRFEIPILRTDEMGIIKFKSDGNIISTAL